MKRRDRLTLGFALGGLSAALLLRKSRRSREELNGRVVLITGGSRGLGLALAQEFGRHGSRLALAARDNARLQQVRTDLQTQGIEAEIFTCDVGKQEQVATLIQDVINKFGRLDILVNNAGVIQVGPAEEMTVEDFREASDIMFWGPLHAIFESLPHFRRQGGGHVVNIASIGGKVSVPHLLPYNCAKFAQVGLSEGLRAELAGENIHVMTVAPGLMRTGSHLNAEFRGRRQREFTWFGLSANTPLLTMTPARAAEAIVEGLRRRRGELILSLPAKALALLHGVAPETTITALGLGSRLLPSRRRNAEASDKETGRQIQEHARGIRKRLIEKAGHEAVARYQS